MVLNLSSELSRDYEKVDNVLKAAHKSTYLAIQVHQEHLTRIRCYPEKQKDIFQHLFK